jgi:hypothetical protein
MTLGERVGGVDEDTTVPLGQAAQGSLDVLPAWSFEREIRPFAEKW